MRFRTSGDQVGQLGHLVEVAGRGEARQAERIEGVAGQQLQVLVLRVESLGGRVVEEIALAYGVDRLQLRIERLVDVVDVAHSSESASFAASMVRSTCSSVCASDGNQASNWDAGG